jgi:N-acetylglutamate synthase-like GNAT family acetyltransferase
MLIRESVDSDFSAILAIVNDAARVYHGVIPADRWHDPYMSAEELEREIAAGVAFWIAEEDGRLSGVMGIQDKGDVALVRHAYVDPSAQRSGVGTKLLRHVESLVDKPILIGTWATASWAIDFYRRNGFDVVSEAEKDRLLRRYWSIPARQIETSVVLANPRWTKGLAATLSMLLLVFLAACQALNPSLRPLPAALRADSAQIHVRRSDYAYGADIPFVFTNTTAKPLSVAGCGGPTFPGLEKKVNDRWVAAYNPVYLMCLTKPDFMLKSGETFRNVVQFSAYEPGHNTHPTLEVESIDGIYRLRWVLVEGTDATAKDARQVEAISNEFRMVLTDASPRQSQRLFNGRDLTGWDVDVPAADSNVRLRSPFVVRNGMLVSLGEPRGHLLSDSIYRNYRLEVEYRFSAAPGNAGVLVHASTPRALYGMFPRSIEVQMESGNAGDFWCIVEDIRVPDMERRRGPRSDWGITEGKARRIRNLTDDSEKPLGQWNTMVIEAVSRSIRVWVNGDLVNDGYNATADRGRIALQSEGSEVEFRKISLTPLGKR